jgi:hypothetical protein
VHNSVIFFLSKFTVVQSSPQSNCKTTTILFYREHDFFCLFCFIFAVLGTEPKTSDMLGKHSSTGPHPKSCNAQFPVVKRIPTLV